MNRMNAKVLQKLKNIHANINFTIYLPLEPGPDHTAANISTLHKTVALLRQVLKDVNLAAKDHHAIIKNVLMLEQELGHQMPGKGIAIFIFDSNEVEMYALPFSAQPALIYGLPSMHLEPLVQYYKKTTPYWVLMLSQNGCRLFKGDGNEINAIKDKTLETSMLTTLRLDEINEPDIQSHSANKGGQKASESFHGHGGFKDMRKKYLQDYFRVMDKQLGRYVSNKTEPVILIGVDYVQAMYKKMSKHKYLALTRSALNPHDVNKVSLMQVINPMLEKGLSTSQV